MVVSKILGIFNPTWGSDPIWLVFSHGLVQPPTSNGQKPRTKIPPPKKILKLTILLVTFFGRSMQTETSKRTQDFPFCYWWSLVDFMCSFWVKIIKMGRKLRSKEWEACKYCWVTKEQSLFQCDVVVIRYIFRHEIWIPGSQADHQKILYSPLECWWSGSPVK